MRTLDLTGSRPYRPMARTCLTRPIREKQVLWLKPEPQCHPQFGFMARPLGRKDIEPAAQLWRLAYPEVYGSAHDFLLYPEEYESRFALVETWETDARDKPGCMLVVEEVARSQLVAATLMTKFDKNLHRLNGTLPP